MGICIAAHGEKNFPAEAIHREYIKRVLKPEPARGMKIQEEGRVEETGHSECDISVRLRRESIW